MHEIGLAREVVQTVKDKLKDMKVEGRVSKINLRISKAAAVSPETLRFHFWALAEDTGFENVVLSIKEASVFGVCQNCGLRFAINEEELTCPTCKSSKVGVVLDQQVVVESIEVE